MSYYRGKRVFLVGGSEGIGRETAVELARNGAHVWVAARRQGPLDETVAAMRAVGSADQRLGSLALDATDRDAVRASVAGVLEALGGLDVLITNLGAARPGYVTELDDAAFDSMIAVNYTAQATVVRAFIPHLLAQRSGDICFVSSALGFFSTPGYSAYSASKFAIAGFAESLHLELAPQGVRVTLFYPGTTETPGLAAENQSKPAAVWTLESDSAFSKIHKAPDVAKTLVAAIERGRFENFAGLDIWFVWFVYTRFPRLALYLAHDEWRKALKKVASKANPA